VERGLFIAASGMLADQLRQDVIANNLANATTAGFKGDRAVTHAFNSLLLNRLEQGDEIGADRSNESAAQVGTLGLGERVDSVATDLSQGPLRRTGNDLDLAIGGSGFFAVRTAAGVRFTRDGAFTQNAQGQIVTARAEPVLGINGQPITVPAGAKVTVNEQGSVLADERVVGKVQVTLLDPASLKKAGDDMFTGRPQAQGQRGTVNQGYLEQANVSSVREMVDLIATMRSYESSQKTIKAIDETLGKAVNDVGKVG
jgi:flagellar basal-body rod protein FlgF